MFNLTINLENLKGLTLAMQEHTKRFEALDAAEAELLRRFEGWGGPAAQKALAVERAKFEDQREAARLSMRALVAQARAAFNADIDRQTVLSGAMIDAPDGELLRAALVDDPGELSSIQARHLENPTMRRAIAKYAAARGWQGFDDLTNAGDVRTFGEQLFKMAESGATVPTGIGGMTLSDFKYVEQLLAAFGLAE